VATAHHCRAGSRLLAASVWPRLAARTLLCRPYYLTSISTHRITSLGLILARPAAEETQCYFADEGSPLISNRFITSLRRKTVGGRVSSTSAAPRRCTRTRVVAFLAGRGRHPGDAPLSLEPRCKSGVSRTLRAPYLSRASAHVNIISTTRLPPWKELRGLLRAATRVSLGAHRLRHRLFFFGYRLRYRFSKTAAAGSIRRRARTSLLCGNQHYRCRIVTARITYVYGRATETLYLPRRRLAHGQPVATLMSDLAERRSSFMPSTAEENTAALSRRYGDRRIDAPLGLDDSSHTRLTPGLPLIEQIGSGVTCSLSITPP